MDDLNLYEYYGTQMHQEIGFGGDYDNLVGTLYLQFCYESLHKLFQPLIRQIRFFRHG